MTEGLREIADKVKELTGGKRVFLLPPPYKQGHFRVQGDVNLPQSCGFSATSDGRTTTLTADPETLLSALQGMINGENPKVEPSVSPLHTLAFQIFAHFESGVSADVPELLRYALDLEEASPRTKTVFDALCRKLPEQYASALRENRPKSCLPLIVRRMLDTNWIE